MRVTALAAFVGPDDRANPSPLRQNPARDPSWGWTPQDTTPSAATGTFTARRAFIGTTYSITPSGRFGIWVKVEGTTVRTDLNSASSPRFIAFPVPGRSDAFVLADDTAGGASDDWNDVPLLIENVDTIPPATGG